MILRFIIAIVVLTLVGGAIVGFNLFRDSAIEQFFASMQPPPQTVSTVTVEPQSLECATAVAAGCSSRPIRPIFPAKPKIFAL